MKNIRPAQLFAVLANETRLRCLHLVHASTEVSACELATILDLPQPEVDKAMRPLRAVGAFAARQDASGIYFRMNPRIPLWQGDIIEASMQQLRQQEPYRTDRAMFFSLNPEERANAWTTIGAG